MNTSYTGKVNCLNFLDSHVPFGLASAVGPSDKITQHAAIATATSEINPIF
jgi:hypothetical protein